MRDTEIVVYAYAIDTIEESLQLLQQRLGKVDQQRVDVKVNVADIGDHDDRAVTTEIFLAR